MLQFKFNSHQDIVAACEQLAEDLVSFELNSMEQTIVVKSEVPDETLEWLDKVTVSH